MCIRDRLEYGLKVGVRFELESFGLVDLYVIGSVDLQGTRD